MCLSRGWPLRRFKPSTKRVSEGLTGSCAGRHGKQGRRSCSVIPRGSTPESPSDDRVTGCRDSEVVFRSAKSPSFRRFVDEAMPAIRRCCPTPSHGVRWVGVCNLCARPRCTRILNRGNGQCIHASGYLTSVCLHGLALPDFRQIYACFVNVVDPGLAVLRRPSVAVDTSLRSNGVVSSIIPCCLDGTWVARRVRCV